MPSEEAELPQGIRLRQSIEPEQRPCMGAPLQPIPLYPRGFDENATAKTKRRNIRARGKEPRSSGPPAYYTVTSSTPQPQPMQRSHTQHISMIAPHTASPHPRARCVRASWRCLKGDLSSVLTFLHRKIQATQIIYTCEIPLAAVASCIFKTQASDNSIPSPLRLGAKHCLSSPI